MTGRTPLQESSSRESGPWTIHVCPICGASTTIPNRDCRGIARSHPPRARIPVEVVPRAEAQNQESSQRTQAIEAMVALLVGFGWDYDDLHGLVDLAIKEAN